jgi:hypothetical protein
VDEEDARSQSALQAQGSQGGRSASPAQDQGSCGLGAAFWLTVGLVICQLFLMNSLFGSNISPRPIEEQKIIDDLRLIVNVGSLVLAIGLAAVSALLVKRNWPVARVVIGVIVIALIWYLILIGTCVNAPIGEVI